MRPAIGQNEASKPIREHHVGRQEAGRAWSGRLWVCGRPLGRADASSVLQHAIEPPPLRARLEPRATAPLRRQIRVTPEPKWGGTGRTREGVGALEEASQTRAGARFAMGEVEISARAYGKMCLHAARYPYAAVNGLLLAPAPQSGGCLCLTDCVPLFHSHLALSVMLEVALTQVRLLDARPPPP